jgi:hypothetical protein
VVHVVQVPALPSGARAHLERTHPTLLGP